MQEQAVNLQTEPHIALCFEAVPSGYSLSTSDGILKHTVNRNMVQFFDFVQKCFFFPHFHFMESF